MIFQTLLFIIVQLPCIVAALKGKVGDILEFRAQWRTRLIFPQQSGQRLRRDGRESRLCPARLRLDRSGCGQLATVSTRKAQGTRPGLWNIRNGQRERRRHWRTEMATTKKALPHFDTLADTHTGHRTAATRKTWSVHRATEWDGMMFNLKQRCMCVCVCVCGRVR